ncbi:hypothetical protein Ct9H90mP29_17130 [bacterium]|nr:MAG: hypothetical protein Ct9H90mP29_17130 [bacterium]
MKVIKASSLAYKPYIFVFFLGLIFAQQGTIVGTVVSDVDQMPIHGADVYLEKLSLGQHLRLMVTSPLMISLLVR